MQKNGDFKVDKDEILEMLLLRCVIQREFFLWKKYIPPVFNKFKKSIRKCVNGFRSNVLFEWYFKKFCEDTCFHYYMEIEVMFHIPLKWARATKHSVQ